MRVGRAIKIPRQPSHCQLVRFSSLKMHSRRQNPHPHTQSEAPSFIYRARASPDINSELLSERVLINISGENEGVGFLSLLQMECINFSV